MRGQLAELWQSIETGYGILVYARPPPPTVAPVPAWLTTAGYDMATGLGTVNAYNLVQNWKSTFVGTTTTLSGLPTTAITHGQAVPFTINVTPAPSATGNPNLVSLVAQMGSSASNNTGIGPFTLSGGAFSGTTIMLPGGTYGVTAHYAGNGTYGSSDSAPVTVTVNPESSLTKLTLFAYTDCSRDYDVPRNNAHLRIQPVMFRCLLSLAYWLRMDVENISGNVCYNVSLSNPTGIPTYQCPTGQVTLTDNGITPVDLGAPTENHPGHLQLEQPRSC